MNIGPSTPTSIPFRLAQAYGAPSQAGQRSSVDTFARSSQPVAKPAVSSKLVAAAVPGKVDFKPAPAPANTGALPLYRHPADKNQAATSVQVGRSLDIQG
jgi:hypothetical protein